MDSENSSCSSPSDFGKYEFTTRLFSKRLLRVNIFFRFRKTTRVRLVPKGCKSTKFFWLFLPAIYCLKHDIESRRDAFLGNGQVRWALDAAKEEASLSSSSSFGRIGSVGFNSVAPRLPRTRVARVPSARAVFSPRFSNSRRGRGTPSRTPLETRRSIHQSRRSMFCLSQNSFQFSYPCLLLLLLLCLLLLLLLHSSSSSFCIYCVLKVKGSNETLLFLCSFFRRRRRSSRVVLYQRLFLPSLLQRRSRSSTFHHRALLRWTKKDIKP